MDLLEPFLALNLLNTTHTTSSQFWGIVIIPIFVAIVLNYVLLKFIRVPKNLESGRTHTYIGAIKSIITTILYSVAFFYILAQLHINLTPIFASAGIISIILGLGVRSFIEDFFTGTLILTQDIIHVGDYVEIGGTQGVTESLGFRAIRIKDQNGAVHIVPNREIKKIVNYSKRQARVVVDIPIKPNQSLKKIFLALKRAIKKVHIDPVLGPLLSEGSNVQGVESIGAGKILIRVLLLTRPAFRWDIARAYRYAALEELEKAKIELA